MDLDRGAGLTLDATRIPAELHPLIPYVERWGFKSLDDQDEFVKLMLEQRREEVREFNSAIGGLQSRIREWVIGLPEGNKHVSEMTPEDWEHPVWSFLSALKIREITGYEDDNDLDVLAARTRFQQEVRRQAHAKATAAADEAFRKGDYAAYVSTLAPFEDLLTPVQQKKMALATRKASAGTS